MELGYMCPQGLFGQQVLTLKSSLKKKRDYTKMFSHF